MKDISYFISDDIKKNLQLDGFGLNFVYFCFFYDFTSFRKIFININEYTLYMIYISDHRKKGTCLRLNLTPSLLHYISGALDRIEIVGLPHISRII